MQLPKSASDQFMNYCMEDLDRSAIILGLARRPKCSYQDLLDGWPRWKSMHRSLKDKRIWEDVAEPVQEAKVTDVFSEDAYRHSTTQTRRKFTTMKKHQPVTIAEVCEDFVVAHAQSINSCRRSRLGSYLYDLPGLNSGHTSIFRLRLLYFWCKETASRIGSKH